MTIGLVYRVFREMRSSDNSLSSVHPGLKRLTRYYVTIGTGRLDAGHRGIDLCEMPAHHMPPCISAQTDHRSKMTINSGWPVVLSRHRRQSYVSRWLVGWLLLLLRSPVRRHDVMLLCWSQID